jgi:sugar lactone lactonase YvrE
LPGTNYSPESLNASADGSLFVGSLTTGEVVKFAPDSLDFTSFVPAGTLHGATGVFVDDSTGTLFVCEVDVTGANPSDLRSFDLTTGAAKTTYTFPSAAFCNDMAFDTEHNLYVTDSTGSIYVLPHGSASTTLALWKSDPLLQPSSASGFGADGIVYDGVGALYVTAISDSRLLKIPVNADGSAGAVTQLTVTPAISGPDGMRLIDANTVIVVEGGHNVTTVAISGNSATSTVISNRMDNPTSLVKVGNDYFVSEGQLGHLLGTLAGPPNLPFLVQRIPAP